METMSADDPAAFLDEMWARFSYLADERVGAIEAYLASARSGSQTEDQRASAESAAHKLIGALGSFHRPGSDEAARAERLLIEGGSLEELEWLVLLLREAIA
jgi:HPt (histidine-containing phosphotransfer) domain-containing protein